LLIKLAVQLLQNKQHGHRFIYNGTKYAEDSIFQTIFLSYYIYGM